MTNLKLSDQMAIIADLSALLRKDDRDRKDDRSLRRGAHTQTHSAVGRYFAGKAKLSKSTIP